MNNIAFKRAKNTSFKGYFHDDFIVEFHPDPKDVYAKEGKWEILAEDDFDREMLKAPELHAIFCEQKKRIIDSMEISGRVAEIKRLQLSREEREELEKLRKFKKSKMR